MTNGDDSIKTPKEMTEKLLENQSKGYVLNVEGKPIDEENDRIGTGYYVNRGIWDVPLMDFNVIGVYKLLCDAMGVYNTIGKVIIAGGGVRTAYDRPSGDTLSDIDIFFVGKRDDYKTVDGVNRFFDNTPIGNVRTNARKICSHRTSQIRGSRFK